MNARPKHPPQHQHQHQHHHHHHHLHTASSSNPLSTSSIIRQYCTHTSQSRGDTTMSSVGPRKLRRINGRLQACDPCRRRKVACDHGQPVCRRCLRRNEGSRWTYTVSAHSVTPFEIAQPNFSTAVSTGQQLTSIAEPRASSSASPSSHASRRNPPPSGYLGYSSYTSVMNEARQNLPVHQRVASPQNDLDRPSIKLELSGASLATGVTILQQIPTAQDVTPIKKEYFLMHDWVYCIAVKILEALYNDDIYGGCLVAKRNDQDLRRMARAVSINTSQPVNDELAPIHGQLSRAV